MKIRKFTLLLIILFTFTAGSFLITSTVACKDSAPEPTNYAEWKTSNNQAYLEIKAEDYYTLGYLKGSYLILEYMTFDTVLKMLIEQLGIPLEYCYYLASLYDYYIPEPYKQEIQGMADAIPFLTYWDIVFQVVLFDAYYGQIIPSMTGLNIPPIHLGGCTVIASKNRDGTASIGQTMDLSYFFKDTINFVLYQVGYNRKVFQMCMGAMHLIGSTKKLTTVLNLVETVVQGEIGMPTSIKRRLALETSRNAFQYQYIMLTNSFCSSWNWIIADKKTHVIATESIPAVFDMEYLYRRGDYVCKSNRYKNEFFNMFLLDPTYSIERQAKAEELTGYAMMDGNLGLNELMTILGYYDGTESSITRFPFMNPEDPLLTSTLAFLTMKGKSGYFGKGTPITDSWGIIPL